MGRYAQSRRRGGDRIGGQAFPLPAPGDADWIFDASGGNPQATIVSPGSSPTDQFAFWDAMSPGPVSFIGSDDVANIIVDPTGYAPGDDLVGTIAWWDSVSNTQQSAQAPIKTQTI